MVMGCIVSVVIGIINVLRVAIESKNHTPVGPNGHRPKAFHLACERVQPESRQVHVGNGRGGVKRRQNIPKLANMFRVYAAWAVLLKEPF
jgi:hypothetical protein